MADPNPDLGIFREFVLEPVEKATLAASIISLGRRCFESDKKEKRRSEKLKALRDFVAEARKNEDVGPFIDALKHTLEKNDEQLLELITRVEDRNKKLLILIELFFAAPFVGTKHHPQDKERKKFIRWVSNELGIPEDDLKELMKAYRGTLNVHMGRRMKIGIGVVAGVTIGAVGGWALAPAIGGALGAGAGLSGAAAVSHGLALLGGGALASGGAGMAGGIALVAAMGAGFGGLTGLGGTALFTKSGAAHVKIDMMKVQMSIARVVLADQKDTAKVQEIIRLQQQEIYSLKKKLTALQENETENKDKIKHLKAIIKTLERSVRWAEKRAS